MKLEITKVEKNIWGREGRMRVRKWNEGKKKLVKGDGGSDEGKEMSEGN